MILPLYKTNAQVDEEKLKRLCEILEQRFGEKMRLFIFVITKLNNRIEKEKQLHKNASIHEIITNIVPGPCGMDYFDADGVKTFLDIIKREI
jgi:hypothetical protein